MSVFGIIFVSWQSQDLLSRSLTPWIRAREERLGGHTWVIAAVCCPFVGFPQPPVLDDTVSVLQQHRLEGRIDTVIHSRYPFKETEARGGALNWLVDSMDCDLVWQVDSDEIYSAKDIAQISAFVERQPYYTCFKVSFKNRVFDEQSYLAAPFTPFRIHRTRVNGSDGHPWRATCFWDDNNVGYTAADLPDQLCRDVNTAHVTIPTSVAHVSHLSWLSNERSRAKIRYQLEGRGWPECSYRWDEETDRLVFNEDAFLRRGLPLPTVLRDDPAAATQEPGGTGSVSPLSGDPTT